jgi:hypothetical protein
MAVQSSKQCERCNSPKGDWIEDCGCVVATEYYHPDHLDALKEIARLEGLVNTCTCDMDAEATFRFHQREVDKSKLECRNIKLKLRSINRRKQELERNIKLLRAENELLQGFLEREGYTTTDWRGML